MKTIILILIMFTVTGCSNTYMFKKCTVEGACTEIKIKSKNEYPDGYIASFNSETNEFRMEAGSVVRKPNTLEQIGAEVLGNFTNQLLTKENNP